MSIAADQVTVRMGGAVLIEAISLTITPGEVVVLVGANGAGKSTLLRVLAGDLPPTEGEVTVEDRPLSAWRKRDLAKIRAVLPQASSLAFGFTAFEVVLMGRSPHFRGSESREDHAIALEAMRLTQIDHLAGRVYTTLSGGERQRVQLARVLAQIWQGHSPRYLLLDEPTNNLDLAHQHITLRIARQFAACGVGVLAILHDLNLAAQVAERILVLKAGRVYASGTPSEVFTPQVVEATFNLPVLIQPHPCFNCPLVIPLPVVSNRAAPLDKLIHEKENAT
jgi:iron complex transport system ATP-binding protein